MEPIFKHSLNLSSSAALGPLSMICMHWQTQALAEIFCLSYVDHIHMFHMLTIFYTYTANRWDVLYLYTAERRDVLGCKFPTTERFLVALEISWGET